MAIAVLPFLEKFVGRSLMVPLKRLVRQQQSNLDKVESLVSLAVYADRRPLTLPAGNLASLYQCSKSQRRSAPRNSAFSFRTLLPLQPHNLALYQP
jgi:hypothetical protein